ncbi:glycosyltransferase [Amylibacter sp.]|nr:glycosyltransferase [Amylibacter sp.]
MVKVLYISYDGLLDPLGQSQILPYISAISAAGHSLTIVSFEKVERTREQIDFLEKKLQKIGVSWVRLAFRSGKFFAIKRFISGVLMIRKMCRDLQPDFVHLRGFVPAVIFQLSCSRVPFLYDFRGFALGEWVDIGKINLSSWLYRILNRLDQKAVKSASGLVVLEKSAKQLLKETYDVPNVPLKVIRTCTDVNLYAKPKNIHSKDNNALRFVFLGGAKFPYRPDLALILIERLLENGVDCNIDFINKGDCGIIKNATDLTSIPKENVRILGCEHSEIPDILATYDCGLVMVETSYWRRVCSPSKTGEYLASGLPVISLEGIDALDELSERTVCVERVSYEKLLGHFQDFSIEQIVSFIRSTGIAHKCQILAKAEFDLEMAGNLYIELYSEMEAQIRQ